MKETNSGFEKLNEMNYGVWSLMMEALLVRKGLWGVVNGDIEEPSTGENSRSMIAYRKKQSEARAELVLHVEPTQLSFIRDPDPSVIWDNLAKMHQSRGMATRLALRRKFLKLQKPEGPMQIFVAEARRLAFELAQIGVTVDDEDMILVLTGGLPPSYDNLVIALDSTPAKDLTLDYVITRLLNEEARQENIAPIAPTSQSEQTTAFYTRVRPDISQITCFNCQRKGHYQSTCPEPRKERAPMAASAVPDDDVAW